MRRTLPTSMLTVLLVALVGTITLADDRRGGEIGGVVGALVPDEEMIGESGATEVELGLRAGTVFSKHWGWFVDGLYSESGTENGLGDARTTIGRSGFDFLFTPQKEARWFVTFGAGWMVVDYEDASFEDFHNPIGSIGFGQRIRLGGNWRLRWELRGDHTLDDARLEDDLVQGHALLAFTWGPGGREAASERPSKPETGGGDEDVDGVRDRRDRCPETPRGATVDSNGCPLDGDRDGVPDGIDGCPRTRVGESVGPDGCLADSDMDGVPDMSDVCLDTPNGAEVDEWGCPKDGDADSIYDGLDECPDTPRGARVDSRGCPADGDGDGVLDGRDRCPETPAGAPVDSRGCMLDSDGDGVHDDIDECPDTPLDTKVVDARGCPHAAPLFEAGRASMVLEGVRFESSRATLTSDSLDILDRVARRLAQQGDVRVEIAGHTDSTGDAGYNLRLSTERANAVRDYLIARGIDPGRLAARGYGETQPIDEGDTPSARARNRRVEIREQP